MIVLRLPVGESIVFSRSRCDACKHRLACVDLVPLLSWSLRRNRCRWCGAAIGWLYPGMEIGALLIAAWALLAASDVMAAPTAILGWTLLTLAVIDARQKILPDVLTLPLILLGLLVAWASPVMDVGAHLAGALIAGAALWSFARLYVLVRGIEGLGLGDVKLFAAGGAWLGWTGAPSVLLIAAASALTWLLLSRGLGVGASLTWRSETPFGPFIAVGIWLTWICGPLG